MPSEVPPPALATNAGRFAGFAGLYDDVRPSPPVELAEVLTRYCGERRPAVVDLGSGTGLSTRWASGWASSVTGVEPNADIREIAERRVPHNARFVGGFAHDTGLAEASADVVVAVQSLHWMEPVDTLAEVARLLRPGGVFAAVDCDWPPTVASAPLERTWSECRRALRVLEARLADGLRGAELEGPVRPDDPAGRADSGRDAHRERSLAGGVRSWSKDEHLERMHGSGHFGWCHELALHRVEVGNAARFVGLFRSQGDYQVLRAAGLDDEILGVTQLAALAERALHGGPRPWWFTYRIRIGVVPGPGPGPGPTGCS